MKLRFILRKAFVLLARGSSCEFSVKVGVAAPARRVGLRCSGPSALGIMFAASVLLAGCNRDSARLFDAMASANEATSISDGVRSGGARSDRDVPIAENEGRQSLAPGAFSDLVAGIQDCKFEGWYIDPQTGKAAHEYFMDRDMTPCEMDSENDIAYFCVKERYHGIDVSRIEMQLSTAAMARGLHFDLPLEDARQILRRELGSEFRRSARSERAESAELLADPKDRAKSVFLCIYPVGY